MRTSRSVFLSAAVIAACSVFSCRAEVSAKTVAPKNVLFIAVDDLRLQGNIFGQDNMKTPNLDRLCAEGVVFNRAYCNVPVCGASRACLLSGVRPTADRFLGFAAKKDEDMPSVPSLGKWFREQGYITLSNGKIYHHANDDLKAWSEPLFDPPRNKTFGEEWSMYQSPESGRLIAEYGAQNPGEKRAKTPVVEAADVPDEGYPDGRLTQKVIEDMRRLSKQDQPFFLTAGFWKPHLPFCAPKKYWDLYSDDEIKLADNQYKPENAPKQAMHKWQELRNYLDVPQKGPVPPDMQKKLVHGYYACVSYVDAQVGKLLDELEALGLKENTIVILWGDHGWHLGEHSLWAKHCNFNRVLNAPLIVSAPGLSQGLQTEAITEFIDIYPSLCDLAGIKKPDHLAGTSFVPVLQNPARSVKEYAFCRFQKGESVVSATYNYTEWYNYKTGEVDARMLYNLDKDPAENTNISENPEYAGVVKKMSDQLSALRQELKK
ncbi:sulfatase [Pontiella sulfatireligans]|uniref:Choline-sulfatase n=1 Tax=Pontiella sulfatireligans TaxID=2750658 RepID=A0A6C2UFI5_9BACT|nr:sulfatase [Pontiella sulfatireligans]SPS74210.1 sulfatase S1_7 [Kiritimatiellales bacterium]VGO18643.1 Choline-sulfatase [Pontiella sulfatireligans]